MREKYYIGIDAGGTSCKARLVNDQSEILAEYQGGSANIRLGADRALNEIIKSSLGCLEQIGKTADNIPRLNVAVGMAGVLHSLDHKKLLEKKQPFASFTLKSDAYIACLSAHAGDDGGIIISGTGSCGFYLKKGKEKIIGGHGFMLGDQGGGADLGRKTIRHSLLSFDRLALQSDLSEKVMCYFDNNPKKMLKWAEGAKPSDYALFAKYCVDAYKANDHLANHLITETINELSTLIRYVFNKTQKPVGIIGGLGNALKDKLLNVNQNQIMMKKIDNLSGAVLLAKQGK